MTCPCAAMCAIPAPSSALIVDSTVDFAIVPPCCCWSAGTSSFWRWGPVIHVRCPPRLDGRQCRSDGITCTRRPSAAHGISCSTPSGITMTSFSSGRRSVVMARPACSASLAVRTSSAGSGITRIRARPLISVTALVCPSWTMKLTSGRPAGVVARGLVRAAEARVSLRTSRSIASNGSPNALALRRFVSACASSGSLGGNGTEARCCSDQRSTSRAVRARSSACPVSSRRGQSP